MSIRLVRMLLLQKQKTIFLLALLSFLLAGCANTASYEKFAYAGTVFTAATDQLLIATREIGIDATSEDILKSKALSEKQVSSKEVSREEATKNLIKIYKISNESDVRLTILVSKLRRQISRLSTYFNYLSKLASGVDIEGTVSSIDGLTKNLKAFGIELQNSGFVQNQDAITSLSTIILNTTIRNTLRAEFNARKEIIRKELVIVEQVLAGLSNFLANEISSATERQHERVVKAPFFEEGIMPQQSIDKWKNTRQYVLTASSTIEELTVAKDKIENLRKAYEELIKEGKSQSIDTVVADINAFFNLIETLRKG